MTQKDIKQRIKDTINTSKNKIEYNINENIETEDFGSQTTYDFTDDLTDLIFEVGKIINNKELIDMFKKPRTIDEIIKCNFKCLTDVEEFEIVSSQEDNNREVKYSYIKEVVKHKPSEKFFLFETQIFQGEIIDNPQFRGEVEKVVVQKTEWKILAT